VAEEEGTPAVPTQDANAATANTMLEKFMGRIVYNMDTAVKQTFRKNFPAAKTQAIVSW
jgi:hypothetical protein